MKTTTFQYKRERTTTHLSGCVVASLFVYAPVVGVKLGGDAAAHPVFCLSSFFLPCHVYALLAHTPLAAHNAQDAKPLQAGVHLHSRMGIRRKLRTGQSLANLKRSFVGANYITKEVAVIFGCQKNWSRPARFFKLTEGVPCYNIAAQQG